MSKIILSILLTFIFSCPILAQISDSAQWIGKLSEHRAAYDAEFRDSTSSPLLPGDRINFETHNYYPPDLKYRVTAKLNRNVNPMEFQMATTTDRKPMYRRYAIATFTINDTLCRLEIYQNIRLSKLEKYKDYLFVPFSDATSGAGSYSGGRYLDLRITDADTIVIDFNYAYNPYCAFNHKYSCPLVPRFNRLPVAIFAGEKVWH